MPKTIAAFIDAIRAAAPNGETVSVRLHANGDWSVYDRPTPAADEVEAVARAIYLAMHGDKGGRWECVEPRYQDQAWGAYARAAIAAMNGGRDAG